MPAGHPPQPRPAHRGRGGGHAAGAERILRPGRGGLRHLLAHRGERLLRGGGLPAPGGERLAGRRPRDAHRPPPHRDRRGSQQRAAGHRPASRPARRADSQGADRRRCGGTAVQPGAAPRRRRGRRRRAARRPRRGRAGAGDPQPGIGAVHRLRLRPRAHPADAAGLDHPRSPRPAPPRGRRCAGDRPCRRPRPPRGGDRPPSARRGSRRRPRPDRSIPDHGGRRRPGHRGLRGGAAPLRGRALRPARRGSEIPRPPARQAGIRAACAAPVEGADRHLGRGAAVPRGAR